MHLQRCAVKWYGDVAKFSKGTVKGETVGKGTGMGKSQLHTSTSISSRGKLESIPAQILLKFPSPELNLFKTVKYGYNTHFP